MRQTSADELTSRDHAAAKAERLLRPAEERRAVLEPLLQLLLIRMIGTEKNQNPQIKLEIERKQAVLGFNGSVHSHQPSS